MNTYHTISIDDLNVKVRPHSIVSVDTKTLEVTVMCDGINTIKNWKLKNIDQLNQLKENCDNLRIDIIWEI